MVNLGRVPPQVKELRLSHEGRQYRLPVPRQALGKVAEAICLPDGTVLSLRDIDGRIEENGVLVIHGPGERGALRPLRTLLAEADD